MKKFIIKSKLIDKETGEECCPQEIDYNENQLDLAIEYLANIHNTASHFNCYDLVIEIVKETY